MTSADRKPLSPTSVAARRPGVSLLAIASAGTLVLTACGGGDEGIATDDETYTHLLVDNVMIDSDPATFYTNEVETLHNVYETLTYYDPNNPDEVEPRLATDWESSEDELTWIFELRDDVTFHSGEPMTAESVVAALDRTIELGEGGAYVWEAVENIEAIDETTVEFQLENPAPIDFVAASNYAAGIYEIPEGAEDEPGSESFDEGNFGTGPYVIEELNHNEEYELTLTQHEEYWGGWEDDQFEQVEFRSVPEGATRAQLLEQGEAHSTAALPPQLVDSVTNHDNIEIHETTSFTNTFMSLNTDREPLDDPLVRQAIAHGINYGEMAEASEGSFVEPGGVVPEDVFGHVEDSDMPNYDPDLAEELMEEAGYDMGSDLVELELIYNEGESDYELMADLLQADLSNINIEVAIEALPQEAALDRARNEDPDERQDIRISSWWGDDPTGISWYNSLYQTEDEPNFNISYYSNPELDEIVEETAELAATDQDAALENYAEMEEMVLDEAPIVYLGETHYQRPVRTEVDGFVDNPFYVSALWAYEMRQD